MMRAWLLSIALVMLAPGFVRADDLALSVKAAFMYKFCSYVEWPPGTFPTSDSPIVIGAIDSDPDMIRRLRETVEGRRVVERPIEVHEFSAAQVPERVHVLYLGPADYAHRGLSQRLKGTPVLIISDNPDGLSQGSSINFSLDDNRVRFDISLAAAEANRLKISSRLLAVARQVKEAAR
ncbi:hypothetical protein G114_08310 [Aeromonas diversa CDC 2478-85]|uniref:Transmembrane protein n=2 Tax=Aeromonas diversa TaxID=502790 RepID=N9U231_9GAMM|nr:hypothetical protein G114_08310 [Aeromonas diversa CDC 2478-85]